MGPGFFSRGSKSDPHHPTPDPQLCSWMYINIILYKKSNESPLLGTTFTRPIDNVFIFMFLLMAMLGTGLNFETAFSAVGACLNNLGPGPQNPKTPRGEKILL